VSSPPDANPYAAPKAQEPGPPKRLELDGFVYRSLNNPGWFVVLALAAFIALALGEIVNASVGAGLMKRMLAGDPVSDGSLASYNSRMQLLNGLRLGAHLMVALGFCLFLPRANRNARYFGYVPLTFTPGWSVGVFFVPIWNLYKPYQSVRELWLASESNPPGNSHVPITPALLPLWWGAWIFTVVSSRLLGTDYHSPTAMQALENMNAARIMNAIAILAAGLCLTVVLALMRRFEVRVQEVDAADRLRAAAQSGDLRADHAP
jgi:hypothetical protein